MSMKVKVTSVTGQPTMPPYPLTLLLCPFCSKDFIIYPWIFWMRRTSAVCEGGMKIKKAGQDSMVLAIEGINSGGRILNKVRLSKVRTKFM